MGFRFQRPLGIPGLRVELWDSGTGIEDRGTWSTTRPRHGEATADVEDGELPFAIIEQGRRPFRALGLVLLMVILAALAFMVAAQG